MLKQEAKLFVAGHRGMVGSALVRELKKQGYSNILHCEREDLDLCRADDVHAWMQEMKPDAIIMTAARVGGIHANKTYPVEFFNSNMAITQNTLMAAHAADVHNYLFLGSACIYPREASQPIQENALLTGPLEPTNEAYALAKIAGIRLASYYRQEYGRCYYSLMPNNLYGPGDNYHPDNSHVIPGLIRRIHEAKETNASAVTLWGSGTPKREFLYVEDLANAVVFMLQQENPPDLTNIGLGYDLTTLELAQKIQTVVGFKGELILDKSKPDGMPRKLLDTTKIQELGWSARFSLDEGLKLTYEHYCKELSNGTVRAY